MPITPVPSTENSSATDPAQAASPIVDQEVAGAVGGHTLESASVAALNEALLEQLAEEDNAWEYVDAVESHQVPAEFRQQHYQPFIALVARCPQSEQDALLARGQTVFRYRVDTARRDVTGLREAGAERTKIAPYVVGPDFLADIIWTPEGVRYALHRNGETEIVDRVQIESTIYLPPQSQLVGTESGAVLLPTGIDEYGDTPLLYRELRHFIGTYLYVHNVGFRNLMTHYVLLTWIYDKFDALPYLRVLGEPESGKTTLLEVVGSICNRPMLAGGATTEAPIFRIIERFRGTFVMDEADFSDSDLYSGVIKILNSGYKRGFMVLRAERGGDDNFDVRPYDVFGPKLLSTRRRFSDNALESRCLSHTMLPLSTLPAGMRYQLGTEFRQATLALRNKLLLWRFRNYHSTTIDMQQPLDGLGPRLTQILLPLVACAESDGMRVALVEHAQRYQAAVREDKRASFAGQVAQALLMRWRHRSEPDRVLQKTVVDALKVELGEGIKIDSKSVGNIIRHTFDLSTFARGGYTWVQITEPQARRLASTYALAFDQFEPVTTARGVAPAVVTPAPARASREPVQ